MTTCIRCHRPLKAPTPTGMGSTCARKANAVPVPEHERDLFGFNPTAAAEAAKYRLQVLIGGMAVEAHMALNRAVRAARERLLG